MDNSRADMSQTCSSGARLAADEQENRRPSADAHTSVTQCDNNNNNFRDNASTSSASATISCVAMCSGDKKKSIIADKIDATQPIKHVECESDGNDEVVPAWPSRSDTRELIRREPVQHKVVSLKDYSQVATGATSSSDKHVLNKSLSQEKRAAASEDNSGGGASHQVAKRKSECLLANDATSRAHSTTPISSRLSGLLAKDAGYSQQQHMMKREMLAESRIDRMRKFLVAPMSLRSSSQSGAHAPGAGGARLSFQAGLSGRSAAAAASLYNRGNATHVGGATAALAAAAANVTGAPGPSGGGGGGRSRTASGASKQAGKTFKVYGCPLQLANNITPLTCYGRADINARQQPVPYVLARLCSYIEENSNQLSHEGIFRVSGNSRLMEKLRIKFDTFGDAPLEIESVDVATSASMLKMYLRELPEPLIPTRMNIHFINMAKKYSAYLSYLNASNPTTTLPQQRERHQSVTGSLMAAPSSSTSCGQQQNGQTTAQQQQQQQQGGSSASAALERQRLSYAYELTKLLRKLPPDNYHLLKYLACFLYRISLKREYNKMCAQALGIVFGPNVFRIRTESYKGLKEQELSNQIMASIISNYTIIFDSDITDPLGNAILERVDESGAATTAAAAVAATTTVASCAVADSGSSTQQQQQQQQQQQVSLVGPTQELRDKPSTSAADEQHDGEHKQATTVEGEHACCKMVQCPSSKRQAEALDSDDNGDDDLESEGESYTPTTGSISYCSSMDSDEIESSFDENEEDDEFDDEDLDDEDEEEPPMSSSECATETSYTPTSSRSAHDDACDDDDDDDADGHDVCAHVGDTTCSASPSPDARHERVAHSSCFRCRRESAAAAAAAAAKQQKLSNACDTTAQPKAADDPATAAAQDSLSELQQSSAAEPKAGPSGNAQRASCRRKAHSSQRKHHRSIDKSQVAQAGRSKFLKRRSSSASSLTRVKHHQPYGARAAGQSSRTARRQQQVGVSSGQRRANKLHSSSHRHRASSKQHHAAGGSLKTHKRQHHQQQQQQRAHSSNKQHIEGCEAPPPTAQPTAQAIAFSMMPEDEFSWDLMQQLAREQQYFDEQLDLTARRFGSLALRAYNSDETLLKSKNYDTEFAHDARDSLPASSLVVDGDDADDAGAAAAAKTGGSTTTSLGAAIRAQRRRFSGQNASDTCMAPSICSNILEGFIEEASTCRQSGGAVADSCGTHKLEPSLFGASSSSFVSLMDMRADDDDDDDDEDPGRDSEQRSAREDSILLQMRCLQDLIESLQRTLEFGAHSRGFTREQANLIKTLLPSSERPSYSDDSSCCLVDHMSAQSLAMAFAHLNPTDNNNNIENNDLVLRSSDLRQWNSLMDAINSKLSLLRQRHQDLKHIREHYLKHHLNRVSTPLPQAGEPAPDEAVDDKRSKCATQPDEQLAEMPHSDEHRPRTPSSTSSPTTSSSSGASGGGCRFGLLCPIGFVYNLDKELHYKRQINARLVKLHEMSLNQLSSEKHEIQKNLLHYERNFGRPGSRLESSLVDHLYDRYHAVKVMRKRKLSNQ